MTGLGIEVDIRTSSAGSRTGEDTPGVRVVPLRSRLGVAVRMIYCSNPSM